MNPILSFEITKDGEILQQLPDVGYESGLDGTLLNQLYPRIKVCRITLPTEKLESYEEAILAGRMSMFQHNCTDYRLVGASGSAKDGKFYCVDAEHVEAVADRLARWPESAIAYFGILVSPLKTMIEVPKVDMLVVPDLFLGTNDCRGWVSERMFAGLKLPAGCFYQFRMAFEYANRGLQAKGAFKVMQNEVADVLGVDVIIPVSSVKPGLLSVGPEGLSVTSPAVFGVREMSRPLEFSSSYTLVEHAPADSIEQEIIPRAQAKIQALKQAWSERNHAAIVEMIGAKYSFDRQDEGSEEELRAIEALLLADGSGEITRHPYVHQQLDKLLARWAFKVTTGGGFELPAFALADDGYLFVANGFLYTAADWLPRDMAITTVPSTHGLCVRYPIRMFEDLLPARHLHPEEVAGLLSQKQQVEPDVAEQIVRQQICLANTYILHSQTAKENGGDFDFDYVCVVDSDRFPRFVSARFNLTQRTAGVIKDKQRKAKSPWFNKEFVALKMRGNRIGSISDLKTRCYAAGRSDLAYLLVAELQKELDSLKHGVRADSAVLAEIREKVPPCPWLSLKNIENVSQLPSALDVLPTDQVGHLYNALRKEIEEMFEPAMDLSAFRGLMAGTNPTREMFDEVLVLNSTYAALHASLAKKRRAAEAMVAKAEKALESAGKKEDAKRKAEQKLAQARAHLKQALESSKDQAGTMAKIVCAWAQGKTRDREAWAEALHQTVSRGKGMGSILFHAFPQELVSATAQRTGGVCTKVQTKKVVGYVAIDDLAFFQCNGNGRRFLFRYDDKKRAIVLS